MIDSTTKNIQLIHQKGNNITLKIAAQFPPFG